MICWNHLLRCAPSRRLSGTARRWLSADALYERLATPVQSYISTTRDPYLNLSIEHYLLQKSAPESAVLFLYVNRPSIIIGRNQNPWLEVNLALLNVGARDHPETEPPGIGAIDLVRRRSGGGTVWHDEGNVNWTVICPSAHFTRDKHAEMVTRALRDCGVERARVNERHDIVLDQGEQQAEVDPNDTHSTPYTDLDGTGLRPLKISGSAYKLTRNRALHHGTCLLSSPNLNVIPDYLHSPAKPYIKARGVESVSSPVSNVLVSNERFMAAVQRHFAKQYTNSGHCQESELGAEQLDVVADGYDALKSLDWIYLQTPQFTISNKADMDAPMDFDLTVRHGIITESGAGLEVDCMNNHRLHEIPSWAEELEQQSMSATEKSYLSKWLQRTIPPSQYRP